MLQRFVSCFLEGLILLFEISDLLLQRNVVGISYPGLFIVCHVQNIVVLGVEGKISSFLFGPQTFKTIRG